MFPPAQGGRLCLLTMLLASSLYTVSSQPSGSVVCDFSKDTLTMTMYAIANGAIITDIFVSDAVSNRQEQCVITGNGTANNSYKATGKINVEIDIAVGPDCGIEHDAQTNRYIGRLRTCREIDRTREGDVILEYSCSRDTSIPDQISITQNVDVLPPIVLEFAIENVELKAVDEDGDLMVSASIGEPFFLRLEYKRDLSLNYGYNMKGAYCRKMFVSPDNQFLTTVYDILDENGCPQKDRSFMRSNTNFVYRPDQSGDLRLLSYWIGPLLVAAFAKRDTVYFACEVEFCYEDGDQRCIDFCQYNLDRNATGRRRRRSITSPHNETQYRRITTSFTIVDHAPDTGLPTEVIWVLVGAALIVVIVGILSCLACVLVRNRRRRRSSRSKYSKQTNTASSASSTTDSSSRYSHGYGHKSSLSNKFSNIPMKY